MTLVAVAAIGLTAGACSLRPPGGAGTYSALPPQVASLTPTVAVPAPLPSGFEAEPVPGVMPGDLKGSATRPSSGGIEPLAALSASARERSRWETLRPGDLVRKPVVVGQGAAPVGGGAAIGAAFAAPPSPAAAAAHDGPKADAKTYDREAAMQGLINGGRSAGKGICSGC